MGSQCRKCDTRKMKRSPRGDRVRGQVEELGYECKKCGAKWNQVINDNERNPFKKITWRKVA